MSQPLADITRRVLIVDDRPDVATTMADLCQALGWATVLSEDGQAMAELLDAHRPDAVIVDVMMPGQDGYEALKDVAARSPDLPVLLVTGHGDDWLRIGQTLGRAQGLTAVQTAAKPVRVAVLRAFLDSVARG